MKLGGKNKHKSWIHDWHIQKDPLSLGQLGGGLILKNLKK